MKHRALYECSTVLYLLQAPCCDNLLMARSDPQVNLRIPEELKQSLEAAAQKSGRSLTAEIVMRLKASFAVNMRSDVTRIPPGRSLRIFPSIEGNGLVIEEYDLAAGPPAVVPPGAYNPVDDE